MKTFTRDYSFKDNRDELFEEYFGGLKGCVFDIETTGLSAARGRCKVIMTAMLVPTDCGVRITQFLAESPYEEDRVIASTIDYFVREGIDYLVTYNGASFDIPFMRTRIEQLHLPYTFNMYNLDLFAFFKNNTLLKTKLKSLSQSSVESYFKIRSDRKDVITGKENVKLYFEYATSHDSTIEKIILTHNREDVLQLYRLLVIASRNGFAEILNRDDFHEAIARSGLPAGPGACLTAQPSAGRRCLRVRGRQRRSPKLWDYPPYNSAPGISSHNAIDNANATDIDNSIDTATATDKNSTLDTTMAIDRDSTIDTATAIGSDIATNSNMASTNAASASDDTTDNSSFTRTTAHDARPIKVYFDDTLPDFPYTARIFSETDYDMSVEFDGPTHSFEINLPLHYQEGVTFCDFLDLGCTLDILEEYAITKLDNYSNGYLFLIDDSGVHWREVNALTFLLCDMAWDRVQSL